MYSNYGIAFSQVILLISTLVIVIVEKYGQPLIFPEFLLIKTI